MQTTYDNSFDPNHADARLGARLGARLALGMIRVYQCVSRHTPPCCPYYPTCSAYASEAITRHGLRNGSRLAAGRLGRCTPFGGSGADPVPVDLATPQGAEGVPLKAILGGIVKGLTMNGVWCLGGGCFSYCAYQLALALIATLLGIPLWLIGLSDDTVFAITLPITILGAVIVGYTQWEVMQGRAPFASRGGLPDDLATTHAVDDADAHDPDEDDADPVGLRVRDLAARGLSIENIARRMTRDDATGRVWSAAEVDEILDDLERALTPSGAHDAPTRPEPRDGSLEASRWRGLLTEFAQRPGRTVYGVGMLLVAGGVMLVLPLYWLGILLGIWNAD